MELYNLDKMQFLTAQKIFLYYNGQKEIDTNYILLLRKIRLD